MSRDELSEIPKSNIVNAGARPIGRRSCLYYFTTSTHCIAHCQHCNIVELRRACNECVQIRLYIRKKRPPARRRAGYSCPAFAQMSRPVEISTMPSHTVTNISAGVFSQSRGVFSPNTPCGGLPPSTPFFCSTFVITISILFHLKSSYNSTQIKLCVHPRRMFTI